MASASMMFMRFMQPGVVVKQKKLCQHINMALREKYALFNKLMMTEVRLRKYFNYFRSNGLLPIIATSEGCSISYDQTIISKQVKSLEQRSRSTMKAAEGMRRFL